MTPAGHYRVGPIGFTVEETDDGWWIRFPGLDGLGARLVADGSAWKVIGGPTDGATVTFDVDGGRIGGVVPIDRVAEPIPPIPGFGVEPPTFPPHPERDARFARIWETRSDFRDLGYPKHEFLSWLERRGDLVFHGSNLADITVFRTTRQSIELDDVAGRGNLQAVYATIRPMWAWYFAVVDRRRIRGSLRNGVSEFLDRAGERHLRYYLSLAIQDLDTRPFTDGAIYVFDRAHFAPIPLYPGGPESPEWACFEPIEPLARIPVTPDEYPLLGRIGGHDEAAMIEYGEAAEQIYELVDDAEVIDTELVVRLAEVPAAGVAERYVALGSEAIPGTERRIDGRELRIAGPPEYLAMLLRRFRPD